MTQSEPVPAGASAPRVPTSAKTHTPAFEPIHSWTMVVLLYSVGQCVQARYWAQHERRYTRWYDAEIMTASSAQGEARYDVEFFDGDFEAAVPERFVRPVRNRIDRGVAGWPISLENQRLLIKTCTRSSRTRPLQDFLETLDGDAGSLHAGSDNDVRIFRVLFLFGPCILSPNSLASRSKSTSQHRETFRVILLSKTFFAVCATLAMNRPTI